MTSDEEMQQMRQQLLETQNLLRQLVAQDEPQSHLHSFGRRPRFDWTPDLLVQDQFSLDRDLFNTEVLSDEARGDLIDKYPPIRQLNYQPPLTMPEAKHRLNTSQAKEDATLKHIQYLLSGAFRPLDILASEICTNEIHNDQSQRFIEIIKDLRSLMLNVNASISSSRTDIAFRAVNPNFRAPSNGNQNYLMSSEAFQSAISQQAATDKIMREAGSRGKRNGNPSSSHPNVGKNNPFFRDGPSMGQGGHSNYNSNNGDPRPQQNLFSQRQNTNPFIKNTHSNAKKQ